MTFRITLRGDAGGRILCDFRCEQCGVFEASVPRDANDFADCPDCGSSSPWSPSPIHGKVKMAEATTGKSERPPGEGFLDTRELGEGMDHEEWADKRQAFRDKRRKQELKELM